MFDGAELDRLAEEGPSAWLDDYFDSLDVDVELATMDADDALAETLDCERIIAAAQARQVRALARFACLRSDPAGGVNEFAADEVAPLLRISRNAAQARLDLATELTTRLPATVTALANGELDLHKARIVADATHPLSDRQATEVEKRVLPRAGDHTPGQLRAALRRAVLRADPHGAERRRQRRVLERAVVLHPQEDGTAQLSAVNLDAADAVAAYRRLDAHARDMSGRDERTMDQRRADALIDLLLGRSTLARPAGAEIHVTVAASTLLGLDDSPGELAGYGPITAQAARELAGCGPATGPASREESTAPATASAARTQAAADPAWRRILTDPASGTVLDVGRTTYRPPVAIADHVRVRDGTCRFPGCRQPARRCDLDHGDPYPHGTTGVCNLCCLCRHHHLLKHRTEWQMQIAADGDITWTSPTGRCYVTAPQPIAEPAADDPGG